MTGWKIVGPDYISIIIRTIPSGFISVSLCLLCELCDSSFLVAQNTEEAQRDTEGYKNRKALPVKPERLLIKVGDDLLSHNCSTIGAGRLNFSVRNGKRWNPVAIVT